MAQRPKKIPLADERRSSLYRRMARARTEEQACSVAGRSLLSVLGVPAVGVYVPMSQERTFRLVFARPRTLISECESFAEQAFSSRRMVARLLEGHTVKGKVKKRRVLALPLQEFGVLVAVLRDSSKPAREALEIIREHASYLCDRLDYFRIRQDLKVAKEDVEAILAQVGDVWIGMDLEGRIQFCSRYWEEEVGRRPEEVVGRRISDFYPVPPGYSWERLWKDLVKRGKTLVFNEFDYFSPATKRKVVVDAVLTPRRDGEGRIVGVLMQVRGVQELKELRIQAQDSEERYRRLFEGINVPVAVFRGSKAELVTWNPRFMDLTGYSDEELAGKTVADFVNPGDLPGVLERFRSRLSGQDAPDVYEIQGIGARGKSRQLEIHVEPHYERGRVAGVLVATLDITERKKAEASLRGFNRQLEVLNQIAQAVSRSLNLDEILRESLKSIIDLVEAESGVIFLHSASAETMSVAAAQGIPPEAQETFREIKVGERWAASASDPSDTVAVTDHAEVLARHQSIKRLDLPEGPLVRVALRSKGRMMGVIVLLFPDGREITGEDKALLSSIGNQVGVGIENGKLYRELKEANKALRVLDEMKDEFVSTVSHELKAPLSSIRGSVDLVLLGKEGEITEGQRRFLSLIKSSTSRLDRLIRDLLDLSRVASGSQEAPPRKASIQALAVEAIEPMRLLASEKQLVLDVENMASLPRVRVVVDRIRQVFTNLISNAIKYTPEGGRIWIDGHVEENELVVGVNDSGIGISPEHHDQVFEEFLQLGPSEVREGGTGLGLTISRKIVEAHGGRIWVESRPGEGSRFLFSLPLKRSRT